MLGLKVSGLGRLAAHLKTQDATVEWASTYGPVYPLLTCVPLAPQDVLQYLQPQPAAQTSG